MSNDLGMLHDFFRILECYDAEQTVAVMYSISNDIFFNGHCYVWIILSVRLFFIPSLVSTDRTFNITPRSLKALPQS